MNGAFFFIRVCNHSLALRMRDPQGELMTGYKLAIMEKTSPDIVQSVKDLARIGPPATEYLVLALNDEDKRVKIAAAKALGDIGDRRCVDSLVMTLGDHDKDIRFASAIALGKVGDQRAVGPLIKTCMDENCFVRIAAREALARVYENVRT